MSIYYIKFNDNNTGGGQYNSTVVSTVPPTFSYDTDSGTDCRLPNIGMTKSSYSITKTVTIKVRQNFDDSLPTYSNTTTSISDAQKNYTFKGWSRFTTYNQQQTDLHLPNTTLSNDYLRSYANTSNHTLTLYAAWLETTDSTTPTYTFPTKTRSGYKLVGYSTTKIPTSKDGELDVYHPGEVLTVSNNSYTFWEIWVPELSTTTTLKSIGKYSWKTLIENQTNPNYVLYNYGGKEGLWGIENTTGSGSETFTSSTFNNLHTFTLRKIPSHIISLLIELELASSPSITATFKTTNLLNPDSRVLDDTTGRYNIIVSIKDNILTLYTVPRYWKVTACVVTYFINENNITYCGGTVYDKNHEHVTSTDIITLGKTYYITEWE